MQRWDRVESQLPIEEYVKLARAGDRAAFGVVIDAHYDFLYRTAYKWSGNREDAEDIAQDVCIKLASVIGSFDGRSAFTSWLYRIVINAVRDRQRAGMRRARQVKALELVSSDEMEPEQEDAVTQSQIWAAVRQLPEKQRDAVLLVYAEDKSHAEAAAIMGTKEATVSWYLHEARKRLKGLL